MTNENENEMANAGLWNTLDELTGAWALLAMPFAITRKIKRLQWGIPHIYVQFTIIWRKTP